MKTKPYRVKCRVLVFATAYVKATDKKEAELKARQGEWLALAVESGTAKYQDTETIEEDK